MYVVYIFDSHMNEDISLLILRRLIIDLCYLYENHNLINHIFSLENFLKFIFIFYWKTFIILESRQCTIFVTPRRLLLKI